MSASEQSIVLVTPVWNDSARIRDYGPHLARDLARSDLPVRWIVADDGSSEDEKRILQDLVAQFSSAYASVELMSFSERTRKGGAIYRAWDACPDADLLAFVDADGAIDSASVVRLLRAASNAGGDVCVIGIRHDDSGTPVRRSFSRVVSFRLFAWLVRCLVGIRYEDTQCGAKVVPGAAYRSVADQLFEEGYVFDVELLVALEEYGCQVEEIRIPWHEVPGGKVHPLRDAWGMVAGLLRVRKRLV